MHLTLQELYHATLSLCTCTQYMYILHQYSLMPHQFYRDMIARERQVHLAVGFDLTLTLLYLQGCDVQAC